MMKRMMWIGLSAILLVLPLTAVAGGVPAKVYENGTNNNPVAVSDVKVEVFGGFGFKALLSSGVSGEGGSCVLGNLPLGKEVIVKLTKAGYVTQYDLRTYSEADVEKGTVLWIGSMANVTGLYKNLGEPLDAGKGQVYLEINDEFTGQGIEGIHLDVSSGRAFDLGMGEYLVVNAEGASLKVGIQKPGYAFDIESAAIPLFPGAMTQSYVKVQTGGAVYESGQATRVTSAMISGFIKRLSDAQPVSGVTVAFTTLKGATVRPSVLTDQTGFYKQTQFPVNKIYKVTPSKPPWKFKPAARNVFVGQKGAKADFKAF